MTVEIQFYAGTNLLHYVDAAAGSGLAFYGDSGFGGSVSVGAYQGRTFVSNGAGTSQGVECNNVKFLNSMSGILGQTGTGISLTAIPNAQATVNIHSVFDSAIKIQNAEARIYDRTDANRGASGVTTKMAEIIHPTVTQLNNGSGDSTWYTPAGSSVTVPLCPNPGVSGQYAGNGSNSLWTDTIHDHYLAISASPDSIGSKTLFGLYVSLEYY